MNLFSAIHGNDIIQYLLYSMRIRLSEGCALVGTLVYYKGVKTAKNVVTMVLDVTVFFFITAFLTN